MSGAAKEAYVPATVGILAKAGGELGHRVLHTLGTSGMSVLVGFGTTVLLARILGPEGMGRYELVIATAGLLTLVFGFSLQSGVTYIVARQEADVVLLARRLAAVAILQGLAAFAAAAAILPSGFAAAFFPLGEGLWIAAAVAVFVTFSALASAWRAVLMGSQLIPQTNWRDLIVRGLHFVMLLSATAALHLSGRSATFVHLLWVTIAAGVVGCLIYLGPISTLPNPTRGTAALEPIVRYSVPSHIGNLSQFLNYRFDIFLLSYFWGAAWVGLYVLAVAVGQLLWLISNAAAAVLFPFISRHPSDTANNVARAVQATRFSLWLSAALALLLAAGGTALLTTVFGPEFGPSSVALFWLLPGLVIFATANVLASYFGGIGKPQLNMIVSVVGLVATVGLGFLLIPPLGILGAAVATTTSYAISSILMMWLFVHRTGVSIGSLLIPQRTDLRLATAAAAAVMGGRGGA